MAASAVAVINETQATTRSPEISGAEGKAKGNFTVDKAILDGKLQQFILSVRLNPRCAFHLLFRFLAVSN